MKNGFQIPGLSIFFTIILLAILIGTGVYAFIQSTPTGDDQAASEEVEQKIEEMQQAESEETDEETVADNGEQPQEADETEAKDQESEAEPKKSSQEQSDATTVGSEESITVTAGHGDGVTHLARRAIAQYEEQNDLDLSAEQKLYAETTLKNQNYQTSLSVGESITFDAGSLDQVVTEAQNLSPTQIEAWGAYTHLVPSLQ